MQLWLSLTRDALADVQCTPLHNVGAWDVGAFSERP